MEGSRQTALGAQGAIRGPGFSWNAQSLASFAVLPLLNVRFMGGSGGENTARGGWA
ncbi:MAG: hypothetical protein OXH83_00280 [Bryobacterales bacterium]|nr:hypothetical protein [Bryobacterales bacterium]